MHVVPQPLPWSSDPASDIAIGIAWRAVTFLTLLFVSLRLAAVTHWHWWLVLMPLIAYAGLLVLAMLFVVALSVVAWAAGNR